MKVSGEYKPRNCVKCRSISTSDTPAFFTVVVVATDSRLITASCSVFEFVLFALSDSGSDSNSSRTGEPSLSCNHVRKDTTAAASRRWHCRIPSASWVFLQAFMRGIGEHTSRRDASGIELLCVGLWCGKHTHIVVSMVGDGSFFDKGIPTGSHVIANGDSISGRGAPVDVVVNTPAVHTHRHVIGEVILHHQNDHNSRTYSITDR